MAELDPRALVPGTRVKVSFEALVVPGAFDECYLRLDNGTMVRYLIGGMKIEEAPSG